MDLQRILLRLVVTLMVFGVLGCGPTPHSKALKELEGHLKDPMAREVKGAPGAQKAYRDARQFRRYALEALDDGKEALSREYAILGNLRYRTAAAIYDMYGAKIRLDAANGKIENDNPRLVALSKKRDDLKAENAMLRRRVADLRDEQRARQQMDGSEDLSADRDAAQMARLDKALEQVRIVQEEADLVDSKRLAPNRYNRAVNLLRSLNSMKSSNRGAIAPLLESAETVRTLFRESRDLAAPLYAEERERLDPVARRASLLQKATTLFGTEFVVAEPVGVRVILAELFPVGDGPVQEHQRDRLDLAVKLATNYDDFFISVEAFTSKDGDATDNLSRSQIRAKEVRDALLANGVKSSRIETQGVGEDRIRYPARASWNDRVEILLNRSE
jgi:outer membrane protein OmpA-like peptidoglycan-associated protein